jgi:hypothetical protein
MPKQNKQLDKNGDDPGYRIGAIVSLTVFLPMPSRFGINAMASSILNGQPQVIGYIVKKT